MWVTIQNHVNVAAVAVLKDIPFIVLASGREPLQELIDSCRKENITLTSSKQDAFNLCGKLYELGIKVKSCTFIGWTCMFILYYRLAPT